MAGRGQTDRHSLTHGSDQAGLLARSPQELATRKRIDILEQGLHEEIANGGIEQTVWDGGTPKGDAQAKHYFGDGVYVRSLLVPAGTCVVGKIHKQARIVIVAQGRCQFVDEFHEEKVSAPWAGEFEAGSKTAVFAFEDTLWFACVATNNKDSKEAFDEVCVATYQEYEAHVRNMRERMKCLSEQ